MQGCICAHSWSRWNVAAFPRRQAFSARPTLEVGDTKLADSRFRWQFSKQCITKETASEIHEAFFGPARQGKPFFRRRDLWPSLLLLIRILLFCREILPWEKFGDWEGIKIMCVSSANSLLYLLGGWTWTWHGQVMKSWLVFSFVPWCVQSAYLCLFCSIFSLLSLLGRPIGFCHISSSGPSCMWAVTSSMKSEVRKCGSSCEREKKWYVP